MKLSKTTKVALAILILAAVAMLSVGITLAVVSTGKNVCTCAACGQNQAADAGTLQTQPDEPDTSDVSDTSDGADETAAADTDSISIPGYDYIDLKAGSLEQSFTLYNPEVNTCYFHISLMLNGETLWRSELLAPGQTVSQQTLSHALESGEYTAVLKYECFADKEKSKQLNGSEISFTMRVK
jgi:hypothetical protein